MNSGEMPEKIGGVTLDYRWLPEGAVYNEGDDVEERVLAVLKSGQDPLEALKEDDRWPVLYQLSSRRQVIVEPMTLKKTDRVLEIGAGMGPLTGALASRCGYVDCVELSARRSLANAYRNRAHDNITIYVGNFEAVQLPEQYDVITLIGVLEYAASYIHTQGDPFEAMLRRAGEMLKPGGLIYIAIENRLGMKYFAGCREDHLGLYFAGVEGYPAGGGVRTFTHSELRALLDRSGFDSPYFYYPCPDYKLPSVIYSQDMMPSREAYISDGVSYDQPRSRLFSEQEAMHSLAGTEEQKTFANSFLIEARKR